MQEGFSLSLMHYTVHQLGWPGPGTQQPYNSQLTLSVSLKSLRMKTHLPHESHNTVITVIDLLSNSRLQVQEVKASRLVQRLRPKPAQSHFCPILLIIIEAITEPA